ncbi:hypothetical protein [Alicyclobacillus fastidiosus]|nr:hypothetical protein [Alicyclobacillus fastidiosus]
MSAIQEAAPFTDDCSTATVPTCFYRLPSTERYLEMEMRLHKPFTVSEMIQTILPTFTMAGMGMVDTVEQPWLWHQLLDLLQSV